MANPHNLTLLFVLEQVIAAMSQVRGGKGPKATTIYYINKEVWKKIKKIIEELCEMVDITIQETCPDYSHSVDKHMTVLLFRRKHAQEARKIS